MKYKIAINGFGRIGKAFLRSILADAKALERLEIVALNMGPAPIDQAAYSFTYDSILSRYQGKAFVENQQLVVQQELSGKNYELRIQLLAQKEPADCQWEQYKLDWLVDCSGQLKKSEQLLFYKTKLSAKLLISAPCNDADCTIVPGVNDAHFQPENDKVVSLASCTTNCFAQLIHVLDQSIGFRQGLMTTVHAYTNTQALLDGPTTDPRRGRAAALNIVPSSTGADTVIAELFPHLADRLGAVSLRVPVPNVSLVDFSFVPEKSTNKEELNALFKKASEKNSYLAYSQEPLVSSDFIENPASAIFDATLTITRGELCKIAAWYDNEYGYATRMKDFLLTR